MKIKPIEKKKISEQVLEQIKNNIIMGAWPPGSKIPSEQKLAKLFNVSRISVRDAIHRLVGMGVLIRKKGDGTYVNEIIPSQYFKNLLPMLIIEQPELVEVLEFRKIIEVESVRLAADRATDEDLEVLEKNLEKMKETKGNYEQFAIYDINFHTAIAFSTKNRVIIRVTSVMYDILKMAMEMAVKIVGFEDGIYYHTKILECIKKKDGNAAAEMMQQHIENVIVKFERKKELS